MFLSLYGESIAIWRNGISLVVYNLAILLGYDLNRFGIYFTDIDCVEKIAHETMVLSVSFHMNLWIAIGTVVHAVVQR
jgi:hypothetical protein